MRQIIDRITCDKCGQLFDFERLRVDERPIVARIENVTEWLKKRGWNCLWLPDSSFAFVDLCPHCAASPKG